MFSDLLEELVELPDTVLDDRIRSLELERRRLDAEFAAAVAVAKQRQLPAIDGHRSINAYLRATTNCSSSEASRWRGLSRAVDYIDGLGDAWLDGRLGISQAARFGALHGNRRVRHRLGDLSTLLLETAERLPYSDFDVCVERFIANADPDGAHNGRDDAIAHRDAHIGEVAGMIDIHAHGGDPLIAAELIAIHDRFAKAEYQADLATRRDRHGDEADQHPLPRTASQRRFDALVAIFRDAASAKSVGSAAEPLVNVVIDADTWASVVANRGLATRHDLEGNPIDPFTGLSRPADLLEELMASPETLHDRRCETSTGITVHPHDALRAALAGHIRRVVVDSDGVVIDLGRRQRLFTGTAREAAQLLIRRCEHPGCELPTEWCDVDHATEWADGGRTDQHNSRIRCGSHNTEKTRKRWRSRRSVDGRTHTVRSDGTIMLPAGARTPVFPDLLDEDTPEEIEWMTRLARERVAALKAS